jgi:hypothetical protein
VKEVGDVENWVQRMKNNLKLDHVDHGPSVVFHDLHINYCNLNLLGPQLVLENREEISSQYMVGALHDNERSATCFRSNDSTISFHSLNSFICSSLLKVMP